MPTHSEGPGVGRRRPRRAARGFVFALAPALATLALCTGSARAQDPVADLAVVSKTADVTRAKPGDTVTFTIIAMNNGPEAVDFNVVENPWQLYGDIYPRADFTMIGEECDFGISPDTPACEYGTVQPGQPVTTKAIMTVNADAPRQASNTACVFSFAGPIEDPNTANDCITTTLKIVGPRSH
jgi:hypothetical protein